MLLNNFTATDVTLLKGFEHRGIVPINFPQDICMFRIHGTSFAVTLSYGKTINEKEEALNVLTIFKRSNSTFYKIHEYKSKFMTKIDCSSVDNIGYVAILNTINIQMTPDELLKTASFVYRIKSNALSGETKIDRLQTFAESKQLAVRLWSRDKDLYLVYTYKTNHSSPLQKCTIFKLASNNFNPVDTLPCQNARVIEFFTVNHDLMILVGNYQENNGTTNAFSSIMRYDLSQQQFIEHQKIYTNAITVGKYFFLEREHKRHHFLFIGNSFEINEFGEINYDVLSIIYKYIDGFFIPLQTINVKHVQAVASIISKENEFNLLITSEDREVQIYYYDGWKFQESTLDYTGNSFSSGVSNIRSYDNIIDNTNILVISNINSYGNQWNIFSPTYYIHTDTSNLKAGIINWCSDSFVQIQEFNIDEANELLNAAINLTDSSNSFAKLNGNVLIKNSTIKTINANQFMKKDLSIFNSTSIDRIKNMAERYKRLEKNVHRLKSKIEFTKSSSRYRRQTEETIDDTDLGPIIDTLTVEKSINIQTINGKSINDLVYKSNRRNKKLKSIVANEILIKKELFVDGKIDEIEMSENNVILNVPNQVLHPFTIENLNVENMLTQNVNILPFNDFFMLFKRKIDKKIPNMIHQLDVDVLNVGGLINDANFTDISINSLKNTGNQIVTGNINAEYLTAEGVMFKKNTLSETISNVPISHLINIRDKTKSIEITQDIQFVQPLDVNKLFIRDRLDNVNVLNGELQVMRTKGLQEQIVTGEKSFSSINLKQPIVLRGKIESKTLEKMNPIVTIDKDLVLEGDYSIQGPVTIRKSLNVSENILTNNPYLSLKKLVESGLNLFTTNSTNLRMNFKNVVEANNINAKSINDKKPNLFVKLNYPNEQVITGLKTFENGIKVSGIVEAHTINDVNIERLNETMLKRDAAYTQFVEGNIEFADLSTQKLISPSVTIDNKNIEELLSMNSKNQIVKNMTVNSIRAQQLNAHAINQLNGKKIFGTDLNFIIDDTVKVNSFNNSFIAKKYFANLQVNQLEFSDDNEWKSIIKNFNDRIVLDFNVTGSHVFEKPMIIENLKIYGNINKISSEDILKNWLQIEGDQIFTAPQTFAFLAVDDIKLQNGLINDIELDKLYRESIWINVDEIKLDSLEIDGTLGVHEQITSDLINGVQFDNNIFIRNNTKSYQKLSKIKISSNAHIRELFFDTFNDINVKEFLNMFNEDNGTSNIQINGIATFEKANIEMLNGINLEDFYSKVWLNYQNVTLTGNRIHFEGKNIIEGTLYSDLINNRDLYDSGMNYFSKSSPRNIYAHLNIIGDVRATKNFYTEKVIVPKYINIYDEQLQLNFSDFANNVLKHDITQHIKGNWTIDRLYLHGDYNGLLNGLNMNNDVLHADNIRSEEVTGHKRFGYLIARDIITSHINGIELFDWCENHVKLNSQEPQFVANKVTFMGKVQLHDNLQVRGQINGITIKSDTILTKSSEYQVIKGDVTIDNMVTNNILDRPRSLLIENLKLRDSINGKNWNDVYENVFTTGTSYINSTQLVFEKELEMDIVHTNKSIYGTNMVEFLKGTSLNNELIKFKSNMEQISEVSDNLIESLNDRVVELSHFEHHQSINGVNIQSTVLLSIVIANSFNYALAVHEKNQIETISFYYWNREKHLFLKSDNILSLHFNGEIYNITQFHKIIYSGSDCLYVELYDTQSNKFYQYLMHYQPEIKKFVPFIQSTEDYSMKIFTWSNGSDACYGSVIYQSSDNIKVICNNSPGIVIQTQPIRKISSYDDVLIMLTDDDLVKVYYNSKFYSLPTIINPTSFSSIRYNDKIYLAVQSDRTEGTVHHGYINIYVSLVNEINFQLLQRISLNIPIAVEFSRAPSDDLMLYILTKNPTKALNVFMYAGSSNFVETIGDTTIVSEASDLDVIQIDDNFEVVSIVSGNIVYIIQAVLIKY
ncbi:hypothetical protein PVAND_004601 [Polypedilum vanderplanki]|uniref:Uncharacterized protein n=1 Tax=Polypedilum vanderplanki TaxID=319348 RepID=A0A9J6BXP6_POLVA|nr:hypothetical protein PVAND_004601 [Polypedilum vanderplanki]